MEGVSMEKKGICVFDYLYKRVRVEAINGKIFEGDVVSVDSSVGSYSGEDEIDIGYGTYRIMIKKSEIKSIEVLDE